MKGRITALAALAALLLTAGCAGGRACTREIFAMDTFMRLTAYGSRGQEAVDAAAEEIFRLEGLLSASSPSSEVYRLNEAGGGALSEDTASLLRSSLEAWEATGGLFDCTVYPLMELWGFPTGEYRVPSQEELLAALPLADSSLLQLQGDSLALAPGQRLDFGGIAKGYAASRVMEIFSAYGVQSGLISLGGNIQTLGAKPDGSPWRIGIQDPSRCWRRGIWRWSPPAAMSAGLNRTGRPTSTSWTPAQAARRSRTCSLSRFSPPMESWRTPSPQPSSLWAGRRLSPSGRRAAWIFSWRC